MSILSMDAGFMAQLWAMNPEGNSANPPKNDMYVSEKPDRFVLKEDLKKNH